MENSLVVVSDFQAYSEQAFLSDILHYHTVYYHRIDSPQSEDVPIFTHQNPLWCSNAIVTNDGNYLVLTIFTSRDTAAIQIAKLPRTDGEIRANNLKFKPIVSHLYADYEVQKTFFNFN